MTATALHIVRETALRNWRKTLRRPVPLSFSFVQPLLWLLTFGFLFDRIAQLGPEYVGLRYFDVLLPGVCCMTVLFGASQAGINLVRDLQTGFVQRLVRASAHPGWMLAGMIGADVVRLLAQAAVVALLGLALGARLSPSVPGTVLALAGLAVFAFAWSALSCSIALSAKSQEAMAVFVHVSNMPLLFTSTALVPPRQMPDWLETVARWNPLSLVASALREALLLARIPDAAALLVPLALLGTVLFAIARRAMSRAAME
ncbi:MAG TPA: ABC transporter permease [Candidatus Kapabacteria bacterium]|nr:ABC transporter permease [Candidatus Kapabacteria bacterium]